MNEIATIPGVRRGDIARNLEKIGSGGQGNVYRVKQFRLPGLAFELAYKEYKTGSSGISINGLRALIGARDEMEDRRRQAFDERFVWPLQVVQDDDDQVTGILMRLIPEHFCGECHLPSGKIDRIPLELQHLVCDPARAKRSRMPLPTDRQRLELCEQLSYGIGMLHKAEIIFGDLNPRNVLYSINPLSILFVDCDAARKRGTAAVVGQFHLADWVPPEGMGAPQTVETDRYKLGLAILRILCPTTAGSTGTDAQLASSLLDPTGISLLRDSLSLDPKQRTTARNWANYFKAYRTGQPYVAEPPADPLPPGPTQWRRNPLGGWEQR